MSTQNAGLLKPLTGRNHSMGINITLFMTGGCLPIERKAVKVEDSGMNILYN